MLLPHIFTMWLLAMVALVSTAIWGHMPSRAPPIAVQARASTHADEKPAQAFGACKP